VKFGVIVDVEASRSLRQAEVGAAITAMQYAHWLMVAGAVLVMLGFIGFALQKTTARRLRVI
jgi:hypothetical protein